MKAARMSLARAADKAFKLALRVGGIRQSRLDLADVVEQLEQDWALFPLLHDDGSVGVMCIDAPSAIAFVEQQTLGRVGNASASERKLTRTDKALALPFLEKFLRLFDDALLDAPTAYWTRGYRAEDAVETRHLMVLLLDASEYRGFEMSSEIEGSDRTSLIRFFLPIKDPSTNGKTSKDRKGRDPAPAGKPKLRNAALAAQVEMDAVMCRVSMPLSELGALRPGQLLALPQNAAHQAVLQDKIGQTALSVNLGQLHGMRAVKLAHKPTTRAIQSDRPQETSKGALKGERKIKEVEPAKERVEPAQTEPKANKDDLDALLSGGGA